MAAPGGYATTRTHTGRACWMTARRGYTHGHALHPPRRADSGLSEGRRDETRRLCIAGSISSSDRSAPLPPLATGCVFVRNDLTWFPCRCATCIGRRSVRGHRADAIHPRGLTCRARPGGNVPSVHQLLYRLLPLGPAFNLELIGSYPLAFAGMCWFLRRLGVSVTASLFGAMLFAFSGFNLLHHHHMNMVAVVAHMPWLLAAADVVIADGRSRARGLAFAAVALILASELLLGFPQAVWWTGLALAAYATYRASELRRWRRLGVCAAALAIGILIGAVQWLPSLDVAGRSTRAGGAGDFAVILPLHPSNLLQLWVAVFFEGAVGGSSFHGAGIYSGAILIARLWV